MTTIVIGTRGSALATWQATWVRDALTRANAGLRIRLEVIRTRGDRAPTPGEVAAPVTGLFTTEIENALLAGAIDLAVHSFKDLPTRIPDGLRLGAICGREDPADVLVSKGGATLDELPRGAEVLTGSPRRRALLLNRRADLRVLSVRGNVPTRLRKLDESAARATVLAGAGLRRLGLAGRIVERLDPAEFVPAPGQGALAVEVRNGDDRLADYLRAIDDPQARRATSAERAFLAELGAGCHVPAGAYARLTDGGATLTITGMVSNPDGSQLLRRMISAPAAGEEAAEDIGRSLAERLLDDGGRGILDELTPRRRDASETD